MSDGKYKKIYDEEIVLETIAEYFITHNREKLSVQPIQQVYNAITSANPGMSLPKFSHARRIIIDELICNGLFHEKEALTTAVALRLLKLYEFEDDLSYQLRNHHGKLIDCSVIPCVIPLPDQRILDEVATGIHDETGKKRTKKGIILSICRNLRKKYQDVVIAAIPDFDPIALHGLKDEEHTPLNICTSICLFVADTEKGRALIKELTAVQSEI